MIASRRRAAQIAIGTLISFAAPIPDALAASSIEYRKHDGSWWKSLLENSKMGYIAGFVDGSAFVRRLYRIAQKQSTEQMSQMNFESAGEISDYSEIEYGEFKDGLNTFYKDSLNSHIDTDDSLAYIRDQIRGNTKEYLSKRLEMLRRNAAPRAKGE